MFVGDIIKVTTITFWNVELAFQGPVNGTMNKKNACLETQEKEDLDSYSEFLGYSFISHIYLRVTLPGSKRNPIGIRLEATECGY